MSDWRGNCEIAQRGVELALPLIRQLGRPIELNGEQEAILAIQRHGIDVIVEREPSPLCIEVKGEVTTSPNIFIELIQNRFLEYSPGWYHTITSPILIWVFLDNYHGYIIRTNPLLRWVSRNLYQLPERNGERSTGLTPSWTSITSNIGSENIQHWHCLDTDAEMRQTLKTMKLL